MSIQERTSPDDVIDSLLTSTSETDSRATWHIQKDITKSKRDIKITGYPLIKFIGAKVKCLKGKAAFYVCLQ